MSMIETKAIVSCLENVVNTKKEFVKKMAKVVSDFRKISISEAYELLSHGAGYKDWNTAASDMKSAKTFFFTSLLLKREIEDWKNKTQPQGYQNDKYEEGCLALGGEILSTLTKADEIEVHFYKAFKQILVNKPIHLDGVIPHQGLKIHEMDPYLLMVDYNYIAGDKFESKVDPPAESPEAEVCRKYFSILPHIFVYPAEANAVAVGWSVGQLIALDHVWLSRDAYSIYEKMTTLLHWSEEPTGKWKQIQPEYDWLKQLIWELNLPVITYEEQFKKIRPYLTKALSLEYYAPELPPLEYTEDEAYLDKIEDEEQSRV